MKMHTIIAKTVRGAEYAYNTHESYKVPEKSAEVILKALNDNSWKLTGKEVWHIYKVDDFELTCSFAGFQRMGIRNGKIRISRAA